MPAVKIIKQDGSEVIMTEDQYRIGVTAAHRPGRSKRWNVIKALMATGKSENDAYSYASAILEDISLPGYDESTPDELLKQDLDELSPMDKLAYANSSEYVPNGERGFIKPDVKIKRMAVPDEASEPAPLAPVQIVVVARNAVHARRLRRSGLLAG